MNFTKLDWSKWHRQNHERILLTPGRELHKLPDYDLGVNSRGAFCLRMPRRKYFDVSNRWYAPALRGRKSQNGGGFNKLFGGVSLRNLCKRVRKSTKWFRGVS